MRAARHVKQRRNPLYKRIDIRFYRQARCETYLCYADPRNYPSDVTGCQTAVEKTVKGVRPGNFQAFEFSLHTEQEFRIAAKSEIRGNLRTRPVRTNQPATRQTVFPKCDYSIFLDRTGVGFAVAQARATLLRPVRKIPHQSGCIGGHEEVVTRFERQITQRRGVKADTGNPAHELRRQIEIGVVASFTRMPVVCIPVPGAFLRSSTTTSKPRRARRSAQARPANPAPAMTTSTLFDVHRLHCSGQDTQTFAEISRPLPAP